MRWKLRLRRSLDLVLTFGAFGLVLYATTVMRQPGQSAASAEPTLRPLVRAAH